MRLLLYVGEKLIDEMAVNLAGRPLNTKGLHSEMKVLLEKNRSALKTATHPPMFFVEGVPSRINLFVSLLGRGSAH